MKFGAHISTASPFPETINRAQAAGCDCMQIFVNPPQRWQPVVIKEDDIKQFIKLNSKAKISPIIIHSIYLINLASDNSFFYEASIKSIIDDMKKAEKIGALGVNFHIGSTKGRPFGEVKTKIILAIKDILAATSKEYLIIENSAGAGNIIGDTFEEIAEIINQIKSDRLKVTLDTAHAFASGYNLKTKSGLNETLKRFDETIGLDQLICLHLNDSAVPLASKRDRHADIGSGYLGLEAFRNIINHPKLKNLLGIIETPGNSGKSEVDNLKVLRSMITK